MTQYLSSREAAARLGHIDATFVSCDCLPGASRATYVVRYYPWWDHPTYLHAMETGKRWSVVGGQQASQELVMRAENVLSVKLNRRTQVQEWDFPESHEALRHYESQHEIRLLGDMTPQSLRRELRRKNLPGLSDADLLFTCAYGRDLTPPVTLGVYAQSLSEPLCESLESLGVEFECRQESAGQRRPEMLLIDGSDYVIAESIKVEVPEFEHHPSWVVLE